MEELSDLASLLRTKRLERGFTQQALALAAGIPRRTYQRLEAGYPGSRIDSLVLSLRALGLRLDTSSRRRPTIDELGSVYGHKDLTESASR